MVTRLMALPRISLLCLLIGTGIAASPALAQVNFSFGIVVAPPAVPVEIVPAPRPDYLWAPGYWGWDGGRYVWIEGRWIAARRGYYWVPERWERHAEEEGHHWHFAPGRWERGHGRWDSRSKR